MPKKKVEPLPALLDGTVWKCDACTRIVKTPWPPCYLISGDKHFEPQTCAFTFRVVNWRKVRE